MTPFAARAEDGFSLLEVLVALVLLLVAALGLIDLLVRSALTVERTRRETVAATLAGERLEQLRALSWGSGDASTSPTSDTRTDLSAAAPTTGGAGLAPSPAGTLTTNTAGYVDFCDAAGRWIGRDLPPPPGALFVRRWSVDDAPFAPGALALRVVVGVLAPGTGEMVSKPAPTDLATVKARKAS